MKTLYKQLSVFFIVIACIYVVLFCTIPRKYYSIYDYEFQQTIYARLNTNGLKGNILVGDSKPQLGLNAKCLHAVNLCIGGVGPVEGYYQVRQILADPTDHIDTLFLSYTLTHLVSQNFFYKSSYYNNIISSNYLDSVRDLATRLGDDNYTLKNSVFSTPLDKWIDNPVISGKVRQLKEFAVGGLNATYEYFKKVNSDVKLTGNTQPADGNNQLMNGRVMGLSSDTAIFRRPADKVMPDEELKSKKASQIDKIYLKKIVDLSKAHNVPVVFIMMPGPRTSANYILQHQLTDLQGIFGTNLIYDSSVYDDTWFRDDVGHLNLKGISRFQVFLLKKLYRQ